ncbi:MAG TPA: hypothetical protein VNP72_01735, partial [Longimicrobium sp.]|nr:hypothetical protein [Longimicrobium sp.]
MDRTVRARLAGDTSAAARHARGVARLRWHEQDSTYLRHAIDTLEQAHARAPKDARILNDLAAAYLVLGEREQGLDPMLQALQAAEHAVALDSLLLPALFNCALIQQRLYMLDGATRAWERYLAAESDSAWRTEARAHAWEMTARSTNSVAWDSLLDAPPARIGSMGAARIKEMVRESSVAARERGMEVLGAWGRAFLGNDTLRAGRLLALVREMARAAKEAGLDQGLPRAVEAVDAGAGDPRRLRALA